MYDRIYIDKKYIHYVHIGIYVTHSEDKGATAGHDSHLTVSDINYRRYRGGGLHSTTLFAHHGMKPPIAIALRAAIFLPLSGPVKSK